MFELEPELGKFWFSELRAEYGQAEWVRKQGPSRRNGSGEGVKGGFHLQAVKAKVAEMARAKA